MKSKAGWAQVVIVGNALKLVQASTEIKGSTNSLDQDISASATQHQLDSFSSGGSESSLSSAPRASSQALLDLAEAVRRMSSQPFVTDETQKKMARHLKRLDCFFLDGGT